MAIVLKINDIMSPDTSEDAFNYQQAVRICLLLDSLVWRLWRFSPH